jgi:hypothetical protein
MSKEKIASVDVGDPGHPGSGASRIRCTVYRLTSGRFEVVGDWSTGCNQGYYQENYSYGPWRGRGDDVSSAIDAMLSVVPDDYSADMRRAAQEALYDSEDVIEGGA